MKKKLPKGARHIADVYPDVWAAYEKLGEAVSDAGPMDARTRRLVKLALAVGTNHEGAVHSHARRALAEGIDAETLRQIAVLGIPTLGLARAVAALTWIEDILAKGDAAARADVTLDH